MEKSSSKGAYQLMVSAYKHKRTILTLWFIKNYYLFLDRDVIDDQSTDTLITPISHFTSRGSKDEEGDGREERGLDTSRRRKDEEELDLM